MLIRILSSVVSIPLMILMLIFSVKYPIIINIFFMLVSAFGVYEYISAIGKLKVLPLSIPSILYAGIVPITLGCNIQLELWYGYTAIMLASMILMYEKVMFKDMAYSYSMTTIITYGFSSIISMRDTDLSHGVFYVVVALALPWLADAGAYFVGVFLGKHKLSPKISPKKTIEGAVGGVIICALMVCFTGFIFEKFFFDNGIAVNYINLAIIGLFGAGISILGDLSFSLIKRGNNLKDFGKIIPGHGGILDRFDSVVFVAPFVAICSKYLPMISFVIS